MFATIIMHFWMELENMNKVIKRKNHKSSTRSGTSTSILDLVHLKRPLYPMESMIEVEMESNSYCKFAPNLRS